MQIPKSFKLGGTTWKVKEQAFLPGALGATYSQETTVALLKTLPQQVKEQTFCHELVHTILYSMGIPSAEHDEKFIDGFATFLHQYLNQVK